MSRKTDRKTAETARDALIDEGKLTEFSIHLCPACNEPEFADDRDPNQWLDADRTAWQITPAELAERDPDHVWDHICVEAEKVELDAEGEQLRIRIHPHDYSMDVYETWQSKVDELEKIEQRRAENNGLGEFVSGSERE